MRFSSASWKLIALPALLASAALGCGNGDSSATCGATCGQSSSGGGGSGGNSSGGSGGAATCAPLAATPFDPGAPGTFAGKAGDPCTRDIDCLDGTFCYVVHGTCAKPQLIVGPGKGGHAAGGGACVPRSPFPETCDSLALDWSTPVDVSKNGGSLAESDTALLRAGPSTLLVAWANNATTLSQSNGLALSNDGGKTFQQVAAPVHAASDEENDAALASDGKGTLYYVWEGYGPKFQGAQHVWSATSQDGHTWSQALQVDTDGDDGNGTIPLDFPSVAVNPVNDAPYFTYQITAGSGPTPLKLVVGAKGGASVSPSVELDDGKRPSAYRDLAKGAFDAKGSFYVAWIELLGSGGSTGQGKESGDLQNAIYFTRVDQSNGSLLPLGKDVTVSGKGEAVLFGVPEIHVTPDGATAFVVYQAGVKDAIDVRVAVSHDRGLTWGPSVKVNDDATCATHYHAAAALDAKGRLWVLWYDNRDGAGHLAYSVTADSGQTFQPSRLVTPDAFPFETFQYSVGWLGDYFQVTTSDQEIFAAWSDPHEGDQSHIQFARAPLPP